MGEEGLMFGGTLHGESWPELYPPPPGRQSTSVGGFVEGTQSSTFLLVTVDQRISPCQLASDTLGEATHPLYAVIEATVFWKG